MAIRFDVGLSTQLGGQSHTQLTATRIGPIREDRQAPLVGIESPRLHFPRFAH